MAFILGMVIRMSQIENCVANKNYSELAEYVITDFAIEWRKHLKSKVLEVSGSVAPTDYPFDDERYLENLISLFPQLKPLSPSNRNP